MVMEVIKTLLRDKYTSQNKGKEMKNRMPSIVSNHIIRRAQIGSRGSSGLEGN